MRNADKVVIYATFEDQLLVFNEPYFPELKPQVPGGTIESGETPIDAAKREFYEETGLLLPHSPNFLNEQTYKFEKNGDRITHHRYYFHVTFYEKYSETWDHIEAFASDSNDPILFRFFWMPIDQAKQALGFGFNQSLNALEPAT